MSYLTYGRDEISNVIKTESAHVERSYGDVLKFDSWVILCNVLIVCKVDTYVTLYIYIVCNFNRIICIQIISKF